MGKYWPRINSDKGLNHYQWAEWYKLLSQFTEITITEAISKLYRDGTKKGWWPELNEVVKSCYSINGHPQHTGTVDAPSYHDQIRIRHPKLKNNTDEEIDIVIVGIIFTVIFVGLGHSLYSEIKRRWNLEVYGSEDKPKKQPYSNENR